MVILEYSGNEGRYVKILVEIDLNKPFLCGTMLNFEGEKCWVGFKYEQLPLFCFY